MSALIRLYPAAWRERYEEEFLVLLEARPATLGDRFDVVRGAIDARIHPQVRRSPQDPITDERAADLVIARRLGYGAIVGGAIWLAGWYVASLGPMVFDGHSSYRDGQAAFPLFYLAIGLLIAGIVGELILLPRTARFARVGAIVAIPFLILWSLAPWYLPEFLVTAIGLLTLSVGAVRAKAWSTLTGSVVIGGLIAMTLAIVVAYGGLVELPPDLGAILVAVFGVAIWLGIGGSLVTGAAPARIRPA
jgi:hypothetical protein